MQTRAVPLKHIRPALSLIAATWLVLLAGCAGQEQYQQGAKLMTSGDQEKAVTALRQAVAAEPTNSEYQMKLADAESAAAEVHVRSAESLLNQNRRAEARAELVQALDLMPAHPRATTLLAKIDSAAQPPAPASPVPAEVAPVVAAASPSEATQVDRALPAEPPAVPMHSELQPASAAAAAVQANRPTPVALASPASPQPPASAPVSLSDAPAAPLEPPPETGRAASPVPSRPIPTHGEQAQNGSQVAPPPALIPAGFRGVISRDDKHYPKELPTLDGIVIKLKDTHDHPPRADIEISVEKTHKRYDNLRVGMRINGRGVSRSAYRLIVLTINPDTETVAFSLEAVRDQFRPIAPQR